MHQDKDQHLYLDRCIILIMMVEEMMKGRMYRHNIHTQHRARVKFCPIYVALLVLKRQKVVAVSIASNIDVCGLLLKREILH